jgi:hypothetical protein
MRHLRTACAAGALLLLAACGQSESDAQAEAEVRAGAQAELDKAAQDMRGMGERLTAAAASASAKGNPPPAAFSQEAHALAMCRALLAARGGNMMKPPMGEALAAAQNEIKTDPQALAKCHAQMR